MENIKERMSRGTSLYGAACLAWYEHRTLLLVCMMVLATTFLASVPLAFAHAFDPTDYFKDLLKDAYDNVNDGYNQLIFGTDILLADFTSLFGPNNPGYTILSSVVQSTVTPIGYVILGIVYLVQTAKIASKFDANGTMPAVKEVIFLFFYFVIFKVLIDNSLDFCVAVFNLGNELIIGIRDASGMGQAGQGASILFEEPTEPISWLLLMLRAGILYIACIIVGMLAYFSVFARSLQIYLYSAFAPIPLALLGLDETRQYGTGFIKNYVAVVFAGAIMVFVILMFPTLIYFATQCDEGSREVAVLGACFLFGMALLKSGQWARDILGG